MTVGISLTTKASCRGNFVDLSLECALIAVRMNTKAYNINAYACYMYLAKSNRLYRDISRSGDSKMRTPCQPNVGCPGLSHPAKACHIASGSKKLLAAMCNLVLAMV